MPRRAASPARTRRTPGTTACNVPVKRAQNTPPGPVVCAAPPAPVVSPLPSPPSPESHSALKAAELLLPDDQLRSNQWESASRHQLRCLQCCPPLASICGLFSGRGSAFGCEDRKGDAVAARVAPAQIAANRVAAGYTVTTSLGSPVSNRAPITSARDEPGEDLSAVPMSQRLTAYAAALKSEAVELKRAGDVESAMEKFAEAKLAEREALAVSMREAA